MENREAKLKELREAVRANRNDEEKRREICDNFSFPDSYEEGDGTCCDRCKKPFTKGQRWWHFQGTTENLCDACFLDIMEAEIYRERGLDFETYEGGGTIWVGVEGEEDCVYGR